MDWNIKPTIARSFFADLDFITAIFCVVWCDQWTTTTETNAACYFEDSRVSKSDETIVMVFSLNFNWTAGLDCYTKIKKWIRRVNSWKNIWIVSHLVLRFIVIIDYIFLIHYFGSRSFLCSFFQKFRKKQQYLPCALYSGIIISIIDPFYRKNIYSRAF